MRKMIVWGTLALAMGCGGGPGNGVAHGPGGKADGISVGPVWIFSDRGYTNYLDAHYLSSLGSGDGHIKGVDCAPDLQCDFTYYTAVATRNVHLTVESMTVDPMALARGDACTDNNRTPWGTMGTWIVDDGLGNSGYDYTYSWSYLCDAQQLNLSLVVPPENLGRTR